MSKSLVFSEQIAHLLFSSQKNKQFAQKTLTKVIFFVRFFSTIDLLIPSFLMRDGCESLRLLTKIEQFEKIAQVAHQKWAIKSVLLRSLTKNERPWVICSGRSPKWANERISRFFEQIAHSLIFFSKTSNSLRKPMSEFPTLAESDSSRSRQLNFPKIQKWLTLCGVLPGKIFSLQASPCL